jgi:hypothetical protein
MCLSIMLYSIRPRIEISNTVERNCTHNVRLLDNDSAYYPVWSIFKLTYILESNFAANCSAVA